MDASYLIVGQSSVQEQSGSTGTMSIFEETCYGGSASRCGNICLPDVVTVSAENTDAARQSPPNQGAAGGCQQDQLPGQSGVTSNSEAVVWRCLIIGCGTCNSTADPRCGNCQSSRPTAALARQARRHKQAATKERQAIMTAIDELKANHAARESELLAEQEHALTAARLAGDKHKAKAEALKKEKYSLVVALTAARKANGIAAMKHRAEMLAAAAEHAEPIEKLHAALASRVDLFDAACNGNASMLLELQNLGALGALSEIINTLHAFPIIIKEPKITVLCIACRQGHAAVVEVLLKVPGIDVNFLYEKHGRNALHWASCKGHTEIVQMLLRDERVDVNMTDRYNVWTALMYASRGGHLGALQVLLADRRMDVNSSNSSLRWKTSALIVAARNGQAAAVEVLLADNRVDVNMTDKNGRTALSVAENEAIQAMLLNKGAAMQ